MAVSSLLSPKLPKVMRADNNRAKGSAWGTNMRAMYQKNSPITSRVSPLPINSSTNRHKNCIISTKRLMKNVPAKSRLNWRRINISNFFIRSMMYAGICYACTYFVQS